MSPLISPSNARLWTRLGAFAASLTALALCGCSGASVPGDDDDGGGGSNGSEILGAAVTGSGVGNGGSDATSASDTSVGQGAGSASGPSTGAGQPTDLPCEADEECESRLCNWELEVCITAPLANGNRCGRDEECQSFLCNWETERCANLGGAGAPCNRDDECASGFCDTDAETCG